MSDSTFIQENLDATLRTNRPSTDIQVVDGGVTFVDATLLKRKHRRRRVPSTVQIVASLP